MSQKPISMILRNRVRKMRTFPVQRRIEERGLRFGAANLTRVWGEGEYISVLLSRMPWCVRWRGRAKGKGKGKKGRERGETKKNEYGKRESEGARVTENLWKGSARMGTGEEGIREAKDVWKGEEEGKGKKEGIKWHEKELRGKWKWEKSRRAEEGGRVLEKGSDFDY